MTVWGLQGIEVVLVGLLAFAALFVWFVPLSFYIRGVRALESSLWQLLSFAKAEGDKLAKSFREALRSKNLTSGHSRSEGEKLRQWIWQFETLEERGKRYKGADIPELPTYKTFRLQLEILLSFKQRYGLPIRQSLGRLKRELIKDLEFEKKLSSLLGSHYLQYFLSVLAIWGFIFVQNQLFQLSMAWPIYALCLFWQGLGCTILFVGVLKLRRWWFSGIEKLGLCLHTLSLLSGVGLPQKQVLAHAGVDRLPRFRAKELQQIHSRLEEILWRWKNEGCGLAGELEYLLNDLSFRREKTYDDFQKLLKGSSFSILALFALPSFFIVMFGLVQSFLPEMSSV